MFDKHFFCCYNEPMRTKYRKDTFKCVRCGKKCLQTQKKCDECGLVFARLEEATNAEAKKQFRAPDRSIIMTSQLPKDVKLWKLLLLCAFLGPFGAHCLYVGRYWRGTYMLFCGILATIFVILSTPLPPDWLLAVMGSIPVVFLIGITAFFWISDFVFIAFGKFKVPVALGRKQ
jgi:ribosomal protein L37E